MAHSIRVRFRGALPVDAKDSAAVK